MTKKIYFLLAFLLLIGGGKLWAATDVIVLDPFTSSEVSANAFSREGSLFTVSVTGCNYLNTSKFQLGDGTQFVITPSNSNVKVLSIGFTNVGTGSNDKATCTVNGNSITGNTFLNDKGADNNPKTCTWDNNTDATSFTILFGKIEGNPYAVITSITITYQVMYRGSMPYTWDFDSWPLTTSSMMTANENAKWTTSSSDYLYQLTPSGAALVDGNNDPISETSGLTFTASTAGDIWTDLNTGVGLKSNASVTIPAKTGQKIAVHAWWPAEEMRLMNAEYTSGVNTFIPSSGDGTYEFTATADNVTLQANTSNLYIYSIAVTKNDLTTYVVSNDENYYYGGTSGSAYFNPNTTFTYNPAYTGGHYIRTRVNMNINTTSLTAADFEITSSDETVLDPTGFGKADARETGTSGIYKFIFNGIEAKKPGTATLTIKYKGSDVYNEITCQETFTFAKATPTIAFAETGNQTKNYSTSTYTNVASESTTYGRTITYSSSDTHVATVADGGVVTFVNSGKTVITATAEGDNYYNTATASYTLTVNGTQTPVIAWSSSNGFTESGDDYIAADLPYGNHKSYTAYVLNDDDSGVTNDAIRYGLVEGYEGYLTIDASSGKIEPTRKFADESETEKVVQVYAYIPGSGTRNPAPRIIYNVKIVKGTFSGNLFKQTYLTVNAGCTIAPQNNVQSMNWDDIDAITVAIKTGSPDNAVSGTGTEMVSDYKADTSNKTLYFDTKMKNDIEIVDWFYPVFHGKAVGDVTFTVTLKSKLYGDQSGDFTLHVIAANQHTGFAWASATRKYTIYEGDYMLLPEISGSTNGNFSYSVGAANQSTHHKYVYTRRWDGSAYVPTYNNKNFHKGEGFPNFDLTSDAEGNAAVTEVQADGSNVALLFWNTGQGTENDKLLIYGNKAGTVYLKAFDPQITTRALDLIEIEVKSRSAIDADFSSVVSGMTFPYTWDFTTDYDWSTEIETGTGNWTLDGSTYKTGMSTNINYDYADEDKNQKVWGNDNTDPTTNSNELTSKLLVGKDNKVLRGFAGMKIKLGNNGSGSWYSKRDGIHILPYDISNPGKPRLKVANGTHTLILPTPTGDDCPSEFKVFVKAKALANGKGTLWVRKTNNPAQQNSYYNFNGVKVGDDIIYSVDATKDTPLELDLDKVEIYWIAYSTEENSTVKPSQNSHLNGAATSYSYSKALDLVKSEEVNGLTAYYASSFTNGKDAASAVTLRQVTLDQVSVPANTGLILKSATPSTNYMIADAENKTGYVEPTKSAELSKNFLVAGDGSTVYSTTGTGDDIKTNFVLSYTYKKFEDDGTAMTGYLYDRDWSFYKIIPSAALPLGKAYLQVPGKLRVKSDGTIEDVTPSASRRAADGSDNRPANKAMLDIVYEDEAHGFNATTAINEINNNIVTVDDGAWYTIQGVRVNEPAKGGIYIHNGRKVVIK